MCDQCWREYGSPKIDTPAIRALAPRLREADEFGALHIVISDWNLSKSCISFCLKQPSATLEEKAIANELLAMPLKERASALALCDGYWVAGRGA